MRARRGAWCLACLLLVLTACGGEMVPPAPGGPEIPPVEGAQDPSELPGEDGEAGGAGETGEDEEPAGPVEAALREELEGMSLEAKVGQLFFVRCPAENAVEDVLTYHLGGYILFGRDTQDVTANGLIQAIASYQGAAARQDTAIPLLIGVDEEGGTVVRVSSNPKLRDKKFSSPRKLWQQGEDGLLAVEAEARERSILLKALGFNVDLAPVADVSQDPGDFIYDRTIGEDAQAVSAYVQRVVEVQSRCGLGSVLKHFPGYGDNEDTHTGAAVDSRPVETFLERDFLPFQAGFAAGAASPPMPAVLVSHNIVECMDPELPASLSPEVHRVLREDLGFGGVVMTDDLAMEAVSRYAVGGDAAVLSLQTGNDLVVTSDYRTQIPRAIQAVKDGTLEEGRIDEACLRVLRWKVELGLLELTEDGGLGPAGALRG